MVIVILNSSVLTLIFVCVCLGTNKTFLGFVTVLLNFIFPYKSYFYVVSGSHMRSDIFYLILAEENETH